MHVRWIFASLGVVACTFELAPLEEPSPDAGTAATGGGAGQGAGQGQDAGPSGAAGFGLTGGFAGASGAAAGGGASGIGATGGTGGTAASGTGGIGAGGTGAGGSGGGCSPGQQQVLGACAKCGTLTRTCAANGQWGASTCQNQGVCEPGTLGPALCNDTCEEQRCTISCSWSKCQLELGAKCANAFQKPGHGTNYRCCGPDQWQFCSQVSCDWFPCVSCGSDAGCKAEC